MHDRKTMRLVRLVQEVNLPTALHGDWRLLLYESLVDADDHLALVKGEIDPEKPVLVRVHSECLTGDVFGSRRCDCGQQLRLAMERIQAEGAGVVLYLRQEGRGIGLKHKIEAYKLQEQGFDTVEANVKLGFPPDQREYWVGAQMLKDLGVKKMRLLTNNPHKFAGLEGYGFGLVEMVPLEIPADEHNLRYLRTKRDKMGHLIMSMDTEDEGDGTHTRRKAHGPRQETGCGGGEV